MLRLSHDATSDIVIGDGAGLLYTTDLTQPLHSCDAIYDFRMSTTVSDRQPPKSRCGSLPVHENIFDK